MRAGITVKLALLLASVAILATGLTGYYAYQANRGLLVKQAESSLMVSTNLFSQRLSGALSDMSADVLVLATQPSAAVLAAQDDGSTDTPPKDALAQYFSNFLRYHPEYLQIRLIARAHHGLELVRVDRDGDQMVRVNGDSLQEKAQLPYVFDTLSLAPGQIYLSPITVNHEYGAHSAEGKPTLRIATPVIAGDGTVAGVLVIDVDLGRLLNMLQADMPGAYQMYLANEWGDFLVHPDSAQTFGFEKGHRVLMQNSFPATRALFEKGQTQALLSGLDDPQQAPGQVLAFVRRPFGLSQGNRFIVLGLSQRLDAVLNGAGLLGTQIIRMVLIFSILSVFLAWLFARALTQPLQILAQAATDFFSDQPTPALPLDRHDEIGILARCFDGMRKEIKSQMTVLYKKQHELTHLASHDVLTGLPNRMLFMQKLEQAIQAATVSGDQLAVLFVDLNGFKQINDQYGHSVGDHVLVVVARRLQHVLRGGDMVARLGGDEFIVLIGGVHVSDAIAGIATKILYTLDEEMMLSQQSLKIGASVGVSEFPRDGRSAEELLLNADAAMYAAKSSAGGAYLRFRDMPQDQPPKAPRARFEAPELPG